MLFEVFVKLCYSICKNNLNCLKQKLHFLKFLTKVLAKMPGYKVKYQDDIEQMINGPMLKKLKENNVEYLSVVFYD
jgi:hypothetical protein